MSPIGVRPNWLRVWAIGLALAAIAGVGSLLWLLPPLYNVPQRVDGAAAAGVATKDPLATPDAPKADPHAPEIRRRFDEAVAMLHARQYEYAIASLHRVLELSPRLPEAHVNMGFALLGLKDAQAARDFFAGAAALNPRQANAYYGLALAQQALGNLPEAVGAMRAYLHLESPSARHRGNARAALAEWEARLEAQRHEQPAPRAGAARQPGDAPPRRQEGPGR